MDMIVAVKKIPPGGGNAHSLPLYSNNGPLLQMHQPLLQFIEFFLFTVVIAFDLPIVHL